MSLGPQRPQIRYFLFFLEKKEKSEEVAHAEFSHYPRRRCRALVSAADLPSARHGCCRSRARFTRSCQRRRRRTTRIVGASGRTATVRLVAERLARLSSSQTSNFRPLLSPAGLNALFASRPSGTVSESASATRELPEPILGFSFSLPRTAEIDDAEWENVGLFLRRLYNEGDDMMYLSKSLDSEKKAKSKSYAESFRSLVKMADRPRQNKDRTAMLQAYDESAREFILSTTLNTSSDRIWQASSTLF